MPEAIFWALACLFGAGLGLLYFGGLWLTVRWLPRTRSPAMLALGSLLLRTALTLGGFFAVLAGGFARLVFCLGGFLLMRFVIVARLRRNESQQPELPPEGA